MEGIICRLYRHGVSHTVKKYRRVMPCGERSSMEKELHEGFCRFCGQMVEYDGDVLHDAKGDFMTAAKLVCDCPQAKTYQAKRKNIQLGIKRVEAIAGGDNPVPGEVLSEMKKAVAHIVNRKMEQVTIKINNREKVEVKLTSKGIKVSREIKRKEENEAEMIV